MQILFPAAVAALVAVMAGSATTAAPAPPPEAARGAGAATVTGPGPVAGTTRVTGTTSVARTTTAAGGTVVTAATTVSGSPTIAMATGRVSTRLGLAWPLSPRPAVHRRFEQPRSQWSPGHRGVDLLATVGQPVLSAGEGVVAFSGMIAGRGVISVRHRGGLRTSYEPVDGRLTSGAVVHRGTRIGVVSLSPGHCAPLTCLHWGVISGRSYRDPLSLLGFGRPILLPLG